MSHFLSSSKIYRSIVLEPLLYCRHSKKYIRRFFPLYFTAAQLSHGLNLSLEKSKITVAVRVCLQDLHAHKVIQANKFSCCKLSYNTIIHTDQEFIIIRRSLGICMNNDDISHSYLANRTYKSFIVQLCKSQIELITCPQWKQPFTANYRFLIFNWSVSDNCQTVISAHADKRADILIPIAFLFWKRTIQSIPLSLHIVLFKHA